MTSPCFTAAFQTLQGGKDIAGLELDGRPDFTTGCTIASFKDGKLELAAGAEFVATPPVLDLDGFKAFMQKAKNLNAPVIPTVFLIKSVAIARYIATSGPSPAVPCIPYLVLEPRTGHTTPCRIFLDFPFGYVA